MFRSYSSLTSHVNKLTLVSNTWSKTSTIKLRQSIKRTCSRKIHSDSIKYSQHRVYLLPEFPDNDNDASKNKLIRELDVDLPDLSRLSSEDLYYGIGHLKVEMSLIQKELTTKYKNNEKLEFDEVFTTINKCYYRATVAMGMLLSSHLCLNKLNNQRFLAIYGHISEVTRILSNCEGLYNYVKMLDDSHQKSEVTLDHERLCLLHWYLDKTPFTPFHAQQMYKSEKEKDVFTTVYMRRLLIHYENYKRKYSFRSQYGNLVSNAASLEGLPADLLKVMAEDIENPTKGPWIVSSHPYMRRKFLEYCKDRQLRRQLYEAYVKTGSPHNEGVYNVGEEVSEIRLVRQKMSEILGYENHLDMMIECFHMVDSVETLTNTLDNMLEKAKEGQEDELTMLKEFAVSKGFNDELTHHDIPYYKRWQHEEIVGLSEDETRYFFPLDKVCEAAFKLCETLFGINICLDENTENQEKAFAPLYKVYEVRTGEVLGRFYLDAKFRNDKLYWGADRSKYIPIRVRCEHSREGLATMFFTFPVSDVDGSCNLNFSEVGEFLKTCGNMVSHMLSYHKYTQLSGKLGMEIDALNMIPFFMKEWAFTPYFLKSVCREMDMRVMLKLCLSRHHMAGFELCQELFKANFDIAYHTVSADKIHVFELVEEMYPRHSLVPRSRFDSFPRRFHHIFTNGFECCYFARHIWPSMLAADLFSAFHSALDQDFSDGNERMLRAIGQRLTETIIRPGSSIPTSVKFRNFLNRDPSHEPYLISLGLMDMEDRTVPSTCIIDAKLDTEDTGSGEESDGSSGAVGRSQSI